jgi:hypothetical protein
MRISPPSIHGFTARKLLLGVTAAAVVAGALLAVTGGGRHHPQTVPSSASTGTTVPSLASQGLSPQTPDTVAPSQSPVQVEYDQQFEQGLSGTTAGISALKVPAPAISGGWPILPVANDPATWSTSFLAGLLDVNYARQSRSALGAWLDAQESPELLPGMPAAAANKLLFVSLLDPSAVPGGAQPTPIPSAPVWAADAKASVRQSVSDLLVQADPSWAQVIDQGWQPADPRMTAEDVSGSLTVRRGAVETVHHFTVEVYVGSARWHGGYGSESVTNWQET